MIHGLLATRPAIISLCCSGESLLILSMIRYVPQACPFSILFLNISLSALCMISSRVHFVSSQMAYPLVMDNGERSIVGVSVIPCLERLKTSISSLIRPVILSISSRALHPSMKMMNSSQPFLQTLSLHRTEVCSIFAISCSSISPAS